MARGVNKVILIEAYTNGSSIAQLARDHGLSRSTVRYHLLKAGVLRSRTEGVRMAAREGRLSGNKGVPRKFSAEWKRNISAARVAHAEKYAAGVSVKPSGYVEITRGERKGQGLHRALMEMRLGRRLSSDEIVHHANGDRSDNRLDNLELMSRSEHTRHHVKSRPRDNRGRLI